jgi:ABC-type dipeptide/oligopeptide/nickel transport system permease subunit
VTLDAPRPRRRRAFQSWNAALAAGGLLVASVLTAALFGPALSSLAGSDPYTQVAPRGLTPPTPPDRDHPLGTDAMGRDQLARLLWGARISLAVALTAEALSLLLGLVVGAAAGWLGGAADAILMRAADLLLALPAPLVALAVAAAIPEPEAVPWLGRLPAPSLVVVLLVLGGLGWAGIARLVRGEILRLRSEEYARAAVAAGASGPRVVARHLLPNAMGPVLIAATLGIGGNILMEAWLSFLGVGARPPLPSWGTMVAEGQAHFLTRPWVSLVPGLAILMAVLGFNLLGDGVRDRVDPRHRSVPA